MVLSRQNQIASWRRTLGVVVPGTVRLRDESLRESQMKCRHRPAFTLLEVLIASALVAVLMVLVWSLFGTYTRLEERGNRMALELQLVRSLARQLQSDLDHVAIHPNESRERVPHNSEVHGSAETPVPAGGENKASADESETERDGAQTTVENSTDFTNTSRSLESSTLASMPQATGVKNSVSDTGSSSQLAAPSLGFGETIAIALPRLAFVRGTATRLECLSRLPYSVDISNAEQLPGPETRYAVHQVVSYQWNSPRDLLSLLNADPILNPSLQPQPPAGAANDPSAAGTTIIEPPRPLNPNDSVGLIRETKSYLQYAADAQMMGHNPEFGTGASLPLSLDGSNALLPGQTRLPGDTRLPQVERDFGREPEKSSSPWTSSNQPSQFGDSSWSDPSSDTDSYWEPHIQRHRREHIPEVTRLQFRYSDGKSWWLEWNDVSGKLPAAIEVAFDLDVKAPSVRADEFSQAHERVLAGATVDEVIPVDDEEEDDVLRPLEDEVVKLEDFNPTDPTAIRTTYRFVFAISSAGHVSVSANDDDVEQPERNGTNIGKSGGSEGLETDMSEVPRR